MFLCQFLRTRGGHVELQQLQRNKADEVVGVVEARLRKEVEICDAIFALRMLMEKYRDGQKKLHCVFVDLEKDGLQWAKRQAVRSGREACQSS